MATFLHRLGLGSFRHRWAVTIVWLLVFVGTGVGAVTLSGTMATSFSIPGQESTTALDLIDERFGGGSGGTAQVVVAAPDGAKVSDPAVAAEITAYVQKLAALPGVESASNPLDPQRPTVAPDQSAAYSTVTYGTPAPEITVEQREALLDAVAEARDGGLNTEVSGEASMEPGSDIGGPAEAVGVVVALIVLAITYGSLVAAGMNLLTAIVGVGIGALGITTLSGFVDLQSTTPILAIMLGLAVGIDYTLFIVTRYRHELLHGRDPENATAMAVGTAGSAVVTAGITVVIALAGLAVAGIPFLTEMGIAAAATIVVAVLIAITLVPAVLGFMGRRALPRRLRAAGAVDPEEQGRPFYRAWANTVTRFRTLSLLAAVIVLGVVSIPFFSMQTTLIQPAQAGSTQERAQAIIAERFGPGFSGPLVVLVDGANATARATAIATSFQALDGVEFASLSRARPDDTAAMVAVIASSAPDSQETKDLVHALRSTVDDAGDDEIYVTGQTAISVDVAEKLDQALPRYLILVVGLALVLLILVFRSLLVPVTGVLGFLLTIGSALGATTAVFQWGWLNALVNTETEAPLLSLAPIIVIGILFGLAMDYQVFLVSRMHEAHAHGASPRDAVVTGFKQAAPVVIAAATIMFAVFAGFVPEGNDTIKPIAFALAVGILFDAIIVRMIAVPAALSLMGRAAWWLPSWLSWLPTLDVEGAALERTVPPATVSEMPETAPVPSSQDSTHR
ncbi:RND superfamily putative drug exporter [Catenuloplanes nepalensis]|uniref:RND superfamily putative drug exporter n=1 Tax=Catenuloplanes nepalensis TaxID=587533 RepID=A0ABT9MUU2_9ACTN|nr:MMPL family transporter [Catenuloplanes nepalensis]MDP9795178.1 RND superfamily putative drug exporter [Catenuloplanes nepalensis]